MPEPKHYYPHPGGEAGEPLRWFVCLHGVDNNVAETFEHEGRTAQQNARRIADALNTNELVTTEAVEFSYLHLEAAACMWEHVLHALRKHRETRNPWDEYREAYGMCALRETVIRHAPALEAEYQKAVENGYDKAFDWEYVPKYMEDHVTRILT